MSKLIVYFLLINSAGQCTMKFNVTIGHSHPNKIVGDMVKKGWTNVSEETYNQSEIARGENNPDLDTIERIIHCSDSP